MGDSGEGFKPNLEIVMDIGRINLLGGVVAVFILTTLNLIFVFRLSNLPTLEYWLGVVFLITALPLIYVLLTANGFQRPTIYYIQIFSMLAFIIAELLLDYIFKIEFRNVRWMTILYVMLFFAGTGGMIGIASQAGRIWAITAIVLFLTMTVIAFWQRAKTGL